MASDTALPETLRRGVGRVLDHLARIRYRLLLVNLIVVAVPIAGIGFARTFESEMLRSLEDDMIHQAQLLREALLDDPSGLRLGERTAMLARAARHTRTRIRLLDRDGNVVADSHLGGPPEGEETPASSFFGSREDPYDSRPSTPKPVDIGSRREVRMALDGRYGSATRLWESEDRVFLFSALPITRDRNVAGVVYVTRSTKPVKLAMFRLRTWLFVILAAAIGVTAVLSLFLAATISRPLGRLTRTAERIAAGDRRQRLAMQRRDEIGKLARAFDVMTQRLEARARDTGELAANISHEFKSPLTSIRGAAELLQNGAVDDLPAREKFLGNIIEDTERLDRLVTRLLELARFEADTTPIERFDYHALVTEIVDHARATIEHADDAPRLALAYDSTTEHLAGRKSHIASALQNLVDNALQHAEPGSVVTVTVSDAPGGVRTAVHNRGPVISAAAMQRIWDRFYTTRSKHGGTGLGLAIVASVVVAHGGAVACTSSDEDGTTFRFDLPM